MNMLVNFVRNAMAAATHIQQQPRMMKRTEIVCKYDRHSGTYYFVTQLVQNHTRLKSRGHGGKQPHRFTGIAAARRAAKKRKG